MSKYKTTFLFVSLTLICASGCSKISSFPSLTLTEADEKFLKICKEEHKYDVQVKSALNTRWIYLATQEPIFEIKATKDGPKSSTKSEPAYNINFLESNFKDKTFHIQYDISDLKKYDKSDGYTNSYNDTYKRTQQNILTAIFQAYSDVEKVKGDVEFADKKKDRTHKDLVNAYVKTGKVPDFFVLVITDVKKGIEVKTILNFQDLKKSMSMMRAIPADEYVKRVITEITGHQNMIGDYDGVHLSYEEITWPTFIAKQIKSRITFKYQHSDFSPTEDVDTEVRNLATDTFEAYEFKDFEGAQLHNLAIDSKLTLTKEQLFL